MKSGKKTAREAGAVALLLAITASSGFAQTACNAAPASPLAVGLPGRPFQIVISKDGCWVFASMVGQGAGVAVLRRNQGRLEFCSGGDPASD